MMADFFKDYSYFTAWFFDLDGTLADTDADIRGAWKAALKDLKLECPNFDRDFVAGPPIEAMVKTLFPSLCSEQLIADVRRLFGEHYDHDGYPQTEEYPGILDAVKAVKARGAKVYVLTNKRYVGATGIAHKFGWERVFDDIFAGDRWKDTSIGKLPKPALMRYVMNLLKVSPAECVLVGDTINDFAAARENGVFSIAVPWGYGTEKDRALATARLNMI